MHKKYTQTYNILIKKIGSRVNLHQKYRIKTSNLNVKLIH